MSNTAESTSPALPSMPEGMGHAYSFQVFNTLSFSIVLGVPMLLFFKQLGASATILGIVASLPPLLNLLQIPSARFVEAVGYRKFVLRGWSARSYLILGMAFTAFWPTLDAVSRVALMLMLLFLYNTSRGISACGFLPWMTKLVPEQIRGQYISRDQMSSALASVGSLLLNAYILRNEGTSLYAFGGLFVLSFVAALVSLYFLRKIPDVPVEPTPYSAGKVPWREMFFYPPFFKFLIFNVISQIAFAAAGVFWIPMFRDLFHFSNSKTLWLASISVLVSAGSVFVFGKMIDRVGSRPVIALGLIFFTFHFTGWASASSGAIPLNMWTLAIIQISAGLSGSLFNLGNTRMVMSIVPTMGRSHFFALFSVVTSLILGVMPVVWGIILDTLSNWHYVMWGWEWNKYSLLYIVLALIMLVTQYFLHRLVEARAMPTDEFMRELLINTPSRAITRLFYRKILP